MSQQSLREQIALIPQDITLFHRPLFENIHFGFISVLVTFLFAIMTGVIYQRQKNIFGIAILHAFLGYAAFGIKLI